MVEFLVSGPFTVPVKVQKSGARRIDTARIKDLKKDESRFEKQGCYVFSLISTNGRGRSPIYVGKTEKNTILNEAFNYKNREAVNEYLNEYKKFKGLELFIITQGISPGSPNISSISEIEDYLIAHAARKNRYLINKVGVPKPKWSIRGVFNRKPGAPDGIANEFRKLMGITT